MGADALALARAVLRSAELKAGVAETAPPIDVDQPNQARPLATLLPEGRLPRGAMTSVRGSNALLLAVLATDHKPGEWSAIVGAPTLGMLAAAQAGLELERLVLIPDPGPAAADVLAALVDGFDQVVIGPDARLAPSDRRRILARARDRDVALIDPQNPESATLTLDVDHRTWTGTDDGAGYLKTQTLHLERSGRGANAQPRRYKVTLPDTTGANCIELARTTPAQLRLIS